MSVGCGSVEEDVECAMPSAEALAASLFVCEVTSALHPQQPETSNAKPLPTPQFHPAGSRVHRAGSLPEDRFLKYRQAEINTTSCS